jgi:predicted nuclease of predicted toxin-antitoxin system
MRFLVDMPVSPDVAAWLKENGHDAVHASLIGLYKTKDRDILEAAKADGRIIITADLDFPQLFALSKTDSPGLILFRGGNYSETEMLGLIERVLKKLSESEINNSIVVVDKTRIRRTPLPINK